MVGQDGTRDSVPSIQKMENSELGCFMFPFGPGGAHWEEFPLGIVIDQAYFE